MISERDVAKGKVLISACAIIEGKDHEVLLIYEGDMPYHKRWVLPGGYVRPNETVEQTVAREIEEGY
jgi:ADP-ribose pyrophosphatase YjhB (NUDIX family)